MSTGKEAVAGATRTCPHCRVRILESAIICPGCRHHLRFDPGAGSRAGPSLTPLHIEGKLRHPSSGEPWEYSVVISVRNEKGEELSRQVVAVGALRAHEERTVSLTVEMFAAGGGQGTPRGGGKR